MKKISLILLIVTLLFGAFAFYFMYYADGGADGLSNFLPLVLFGILFICSLLAFLLSLVLKKGQSKTTRNWILGIVVALPILGILSVAGVFSYFTYDYQSQWEDQIIQEKSVLQTLQFEDYDFGVSFQHVSGNVSAYENGKPIPTTITPRIENNKLIVPSDDETYLAPDRLFKIKRDPNQELSTFLDDLKQQLQLVDTSFKITKSKTFSNLPKETEIWVAENPKVSFEDRLVLGQHFLSELSDAPDLIYFIESPQNQDDVWVLIVSGTVFSAPASVEKMSTSNFEDGNLWFHSLEFLD